ncbi:hypothetical protein NQD34_007649 [Periophthalmus magnuspinnatus]|nr:hypothetical protein NQD34_007649 [Periophthalmus magnuspinnatus]
MLFDDPLLSSCPSQTSPDLVNESCTESDPEDHQGAESNHREVEDSVASPVLTPSCAQPETKEAVPDTVSLFRTRAGRLVKPVNRLIQNMTQKNAQTRNAISDFARTLFL